jgi:hypothetical protein
MYKGTDIMNDSLTPLAIAVADAVAVATIMMVGREQLVHPNG